MIQTAATTNMGTDVDLMLYDHPTQQYRALLRFDFSALPAGAVISAASLELYYWYKSGTPAGHNAYCYEVTQTGWVETESTWNRYKALTNWATAGGDFTTEAGAVAVFPADFGWMEWDVLNLVKHFQSTHAEIANFIMLMNESSAANPYFHSNNYVTDTSLCPKLTITYTAPGGIRNNIMIF